jgi:hypothetical protein
MWTLNTTYIKVCLSGILLNGNFVLMAYFSVQFIAVYICTLDITDISEEEDNDVSAVLNLA